MKTAISHFHKIRLPSVLFMPILLLIVGLYTMFPFNTFLPTVFAQADPNNPIDAIGQVEEPPGSAAIRAESGVGDANNPLIFFISMFIQIVTIVAGIWVFVNIVLAAYQFLTSSGDSGTAQKVRTQITNSVIGLLFIILSYTTAGIIGALFFGDPAFILRPTFPIL